MKHDIQSVHSLKKRYTLYYVFSLVVLGLLFCANFGIIYTLVVTPPDEPATVMKYVYLIMIAGFILLLAQGLLVFTRFLSLLGNEAETIRSLNDELEQHSVLDSLTKVFNRHKFESVANREMQNVRRYNSPLTGIMFDVDGFKGINEEYGYGTGDRLLANMAQYIKGKLRNSDYIFRWRGGKFIILAPHTDAEKAVMLAEKLRQMIGHKLFGGKIRMTLSLGVVQATQEDTLETFLQRIQSALTAAKSKGKNRVVLGER
ncbi:MAG: GGDEF domain-containing protein [Desulfovibrio sp.]|nr:GGDEF domain-containing protein [Desulfovibrio sp.]